VTGRARIAIALGVTLRICAAAAATDVELEAAGPIGLAHVGMYYGLVNPADGTWYTATVYDWWGDPHDSHTWLAIADTGASASILGKTTRDAYDAQDAIPMQPYPDVKFSDVGFGGTEDFAVTGSVRVMIADFKTANPDPEDLSVYTACGPVGGPQPPSTHMAASLDQLGGADPDTDIIGMGIFDGRLLQVDPHYLEFGRIGLVMGGSLTRPAPAPSDPRAVYVPATMQGFFPDPQPVDVGDHAMVAMSIRRTAGDDYATRTAIFDTGSPVNFVSESFAAAAGIDLGTSPDLTVTVGGVGGGGTVRPGWYVETLALPLAPPRGADRLLIANTAVFAIPDDEMPGGLDAILGNGVFSPSSSLVDTTVVEWFVDTREAGAARLIVVMPEPATARGDANLDGVVNVLDLARLANHFGETSGVEWTDGDFNEDGSVDVLDLAAVANNFGAGSGGDGEVPEPATAALLALGACLALVRGRR